MPLLLPALVLLAALLSGCVSERGYFTERGYFPERRAAAPRPASSTFFPFFWPAPVETTSPEPTTRVAHVDERMPERWPAAPAEPIAPAAPAPMSIAPTSAEPFDPIPPATARRSRRAMGTGRTDGFGGSAWRPPVLQPRTPEVGSPEWQREKDQSERRERDLNRTLRGICSNC